MVENQYIIPYHVLNKCPLVTHSLFADDTIIFLNGRRSSLNCAMSFLKSYQTTSGQKISLKKSCFFVSNKMAASRMKMIQEITGFTRGKLPFIYLGCPIFKGMSKQVYFEEVVKKISKKVEGWKSKQLSPGGKLILLRHVLSSIPIHTLSVFDIPMVVVERINRILSNFLWGESDGSLKRHWVSWDTVTTTCEEGGLGIRKFIDIMKALRMKFAWRIQNSDSLWARFMKAKHGIMAKDINEVKGTARWKKLQVAWITLKDHIQWMVGKGDVLFWFDNWSHMGPLAEVTDVEVVNPQLKLREVLIKDKNIYKFGFPDDILVALLRGNISLSKEDDIMHWDLEVDGIFRVKSA